MGTCVHFSRSLPSNSWWQTMVGWQVLSRPFAAEGGGRRPAFTGPATQPYSATEVDGWQQLSRVSQNRAAVHSHHPAIIPESSRFGLVALAVTLLFLWAALTQQTILRLHHSTHTGLRSGGLKLSGGPRRALRKRLSVSSLDHGYAPAETKSLLERNNFSPTRCDHRVP